MPLAGRDIKGHHWAIGRKLNSFNKPRRPINTPRPPLTQPRRFALRRSISSRKLIIILLHQTAPQTHYRLRSLPVAMYRHRTPWLDSIQHTLRTVRIRIPQIQIHTQPRVQKTVDIHPPKTGISTVFCRRFLRFQIKAPM